MKFSKAIKTRAATLMLHRKLASARRDRRPVSIHTAGSLGLLFELTDNDTYFKVQGYLQKLQEKKVHVKALGYSETKMAISQMFPVLTFDFFKDSQISWLGRPKAKCIKEFVDTDFDICINIAPDHIFPLHLIAGMSKARLKVGPFSKELGGVAHRDLIKIYDILIRSGENHDQVNFLSDIHEYLTILNPKHDA